MGEPTLDELLLMAEKMMNGGISRQDSPPKATLHAMQRASKRFGIGRTHREFQSFIDEQWPTRIDGGKSHGVLYYRCRDCIIVVNPDKWQVVTIMHYKSRNTPTID